MNIRTIFLFLLLGGAFAAPISYAKSASNPIIYADVPDASIVRVGDSYYMSSTTMHMSPGVPIMKSDDLVNWRIVSYAYDTLAHTDETNLENGKNDYGRGSWASSIRYHDGLFYVSTFSNSLGLSYVFTTDDVEHGSWKKFSFKPKMHDNSLFFDDDGRVYMIHGSGNISLTELLPDASGVKPGGINKVIIHNANKLFGNDVGGLPGEGSQMFKVNGKYYLFNIASPKSHWSRTVLIHRADSIMGPYEGRIALQDRVAQGGLISTPKGDWYAYLFRDRGSVGRIPWLVPVKWQDGWPVLGENGKAPRNLDKLPANHSHIPEIVASDEFDRKQGDVPLPLVWQWNHNPVNELWSVTERPGYLRLKTGRVDVGFESARNTLTQRTFGPVCSGITYLDVSHMKDGDFSGLGLLQKEFGLVGVKVEGEKRFLVMVNAQTKSSIEIERVPLNKTKVYLKTECNFKDLADSAYFYYSLDGKQWYSIGHKLKMAYTMPHFVGYRFALFNYASKKIGGYADFDYFRVDDTLSE